MKEIIISSTGHVVIRKYSTGEVLWEGETPMEFPEFSPASCVIDEYDALMRRLYLKLHRKLWNWIADETERTHKCVDKRDAFKHFGWSDSVSAHCWACQYIRWRRKYRSYEADCENLCLVNWGVSECTGKNLACVFNESSDKSAYKYWEEYHYKGKWKMAAEMARIIANLPERK